MKYKIVIILLLLLTLAASKANAQCQLWRVGTAYTMPKGWFDKGVFQPLRYGLTETTELSTYLLSSILMPSLALKHRWYTTPNNILISSRHGIMYSSMLVKRLQGEGKYHLLPIGEPVPFMLPNYHELLASKFLKPATSCSLPDLLLTITLGFQFTIGKASGLSVVDYPGLYQRSVSYTGGLLWYLGADLEGHLASRLNYSVDVDFYSVDMLKDWSVEHKGLLLFSWTSRWTLAAGYKLHYGTTLGEQYLKVMPLVDLSYKFNFSRKSKMQHGLFNHRLFKHDYPLEADEPLEDEKLDEYYLIDDKNKGKKKKETEPNKKPIAPK